MWLINYSALTGKNTCQFYLKYGLFSVQNFYLGESDRLHKEYLIIPEWDKIIQSKVKDESIWRNTKSLWFAFIKICRGFKSVSKYSLYCGLNQG